MVQHLLGRRGAARIALIPPEVLEALNEGLVPTVNLNEFLALDVARLARNVALQVGIDAGHERLADTLAMLDAFRPVKRHEHVARALYDITGERSDRDRVAHAMATHPSDIARSWAAQWVMFSSLPLAKKLDAVRRFAADPHFGVREVAWMAVRDEVSGAVDEAVRLLERWAVDRDENIRRFASELTRPRGVWCAQVEALKAAPWRGLPVIEPLKADGSRYVQNSVANWLNDASKTQPQWVADVCARWTRESSAAATAYIVRRSMRSIRRRGRTDFAEDAEKSEDVCASSA
ncbi:MAG TPA: DNA alkylation repair protein [Ramlibacter sp.]|uniref:DNA alkylation repair protein n=1 Tax=Ramlibacter sp. TaxID=1917967 RepID=UPI002C328406|nr:DNA alkylation repair protein [Ramlibacter sp.]HVZ44550.1 DNA alkylation repair protein [Ramlibacter sp.]